MTDRTVVLGAGCFWCLDSIARKLKDVTRVRSVYTGGTAQTANYYAVCSGTTGHAEAVEITFNPEQLPAQVLFDVFFSTHDPTTLNRQGHDVGPQYRSAMFYSSEEEKREFQAAIDTAQQHFQDPIVTSLEPLAEVYEAEAEHQDFHARRPEVGYCQFIIDPKIAKLRANWSQWLREDQPVL
ncbi:peptide-methionine (S)-S-oxide reductase MsrA [Nesterenkonia sp. MY13]|uniref:Peptide methionine sulfoxide reductase MsrA n=1 Tax=Nesterenkonia sedimenti TaxID=1463632 RepID=A0A7X8THE5_9MICC|nr:peptide-methionine (S)-S-oxide reductase MsrA [Nesterenkonia sedimenti]NLS08766.1 peptide-methionine (S)-S-oxide reductase MsrA [Nesterenkonia sedimenti]